MGDPRIQHAIAETRRLIDAVERSPYNVNSPRCWDRECRAQLTGRYCGRCGKDNALSRRIWFGAEQRFQVGKEYTSIVFSILLSLAAVATVGLVAVAIIKWAFEELSW